MKICGRAAFKALACAALEALACALRVTLSLSVRVLTRLLDVRSVRAYAAGLRCPTALAATRALLRRESGWTLLVDLHAAKEP